MYLTFFKDHLYRNSFTEPDIHVYTINGQYTDELLAFNIWYIGRKLAVACRPQDLSMISVH